jgi:hypothetical protein
VTTWSTSETVITWQSQDDASITFQVVKQTGGTGGTGGGGSGDVVGPASSVDGRAILFDGTTGKLIKEATAAPVLEGDARLSDARTPTAHAASHQDGGSDELALDASQTTTGQFDVARLGTGTPTVHTFLDGTGAWTSDVPVFVPVKNTTGSTIAKGTPVYATGTVGATSTIEIAPADADDSAKMPAIGLTESSLTANATGFVVVVGTLRGVDTSTYAVNQALYVSTTAGQLTGTKPTGASELIQNIGRVTRVNSSNGEILVLGPGRTNDVPNSISASLLLSGTVATARLGTGTADNTTFLRGDGSWQSPPGGTVDVVSNVASGRILGRTSSGSGDSEELSASDTRTFLGLGTVATSGSASDLTTGTLAAARGGPVVSQPALISTVRQLGLPGIQVNATNNALALGANTIHYTPFVCDFSISVDRILFDVTTAVASSNARVGVYAADTDWQPTGAALIDGTATTATTGAKEITVSATLTAGRYLACIVSDSAISVRGTNVFLPGLNDVNASAFGGGQNIIQGTRRVSLTYPGSLPNTGPAWTTTSAANAITSLTNALILLRYTA